MFFETGEAVSNKTHPGRQVWTSAKPTLTIQSAKPDSDINLIVKRMAKTGTMPITARVPTQGDFSEQVRDYHTAMNMIRTAQQEFNKLPAKIRGRFENDPQQLMDYLSDPENTEESYKLGLRVKPPVVEPEPTLVRVVGTTPAAPAPSGAPAATAATPSTPST